MDPGTNVLVTGASGYLGSHVVRLLLEAGCKVKGTIHSPKDEKKVNHLLELCPQAKDNLELVEVDLCDPTCWANAVEGCTYVHHIASPMFLESPKDDNDILKPTLEGTANVLQACKEAGCVKRVILTSSLYTVSCRGGNSTPFTENDWQEEKKLPAFPLNKVQQERAAWEFVKSLPEGEKFELVVLNPGFMMGPVLSPTLCSSGNLLLRFLDGRMPMVPKFNFNMCDVRDCAQAHVKCMTAPDVAGHRHILAAGPMWLKEFGEVLSEELSDQGYKIPTREIPDIFMAMAAKLDKDISKVRFMAATPINVDNSRQRDVLGMTPTPKEQTLIDMVHSMIEFGQAPKTDAYKGRKSVQGN